MEAECKECGWQGTEDEIVEIKAKEHNGYENSCPECESSDLEWEEVSIFHDYK